jgi:hypothetical protein
LEWYGVDGDCPVLQKIECLVHPDLVNRVKYRHLGVHPEQFSASRPQQPIVSAIFRPTSAATEYSKSAKAYFYTIEADTKDGSDFKYGGCIFKSDKNLTFDKASAVG